MPTPLTFAQDFLQGYQSGSATALNTYNSAIAAEAQKIKNQLVTTQIEQAKMAMEQAADLFPGQLEGQKLQNETHRLNQGLLRTQQEIADLDVKLREETDPLKVQLLQEQLNAARAEAEKFQMEMTVMKQQIEDMNFEPLGGYLDAVSKMNAAGTPESALEVMDAYEEALEIRKTNPNNPAANAILQAYPAVQGLMQNALYGKNAPSTVADEGVSVTSFLPGTHQAGLELGRRVIGSSLEAIGSMAGPLQKRELSAAAKALNASPKRREGTSPEEQARIQLTSMARRRAYELTQKVQGFQGATMAGPNYTPAPGLTPYFVPPAAPEQEDEKE